MSAAEQQAAALQQLRSEVQAQAQRDLMTKMTEKCFAKCAANSKGGSRLERSEQMSPATLELMFSGFCAVSGSPTRPSDYTRYRLNLPLVGGGGEAKKRGYMYYCCWPCVCDVQDFVVADTKTVATADGERQLWWAVIGDPCVNPAKLHEPFTQPFDGRETTLARDAPNVQCDERGKLRGAPRSDHGHVIIGPLFETQRIGVPTLPPPQDQQQPGKIAVDGASGVSYQDEHEYAAMCAERERNGHNSGMGEIFRRVAAVAPLKVAPDRLGVRWERVALPSPAAPIAGATVELR